MSSILVDELPETVEIGGKEYRINTDFRVCLRTIMAFETGELTGYEKQVVTLNNLYPIIPDDAQGALEQASIFLNGGKTEVVENDNDPMRLYSFSHDANFIFSAFKSTHGIDLSTAQLHWWVFLSLFMDLGGETTFSNLIGLRKRVKTGKANADEIRAADDLGDIFELPEPDAQMDPQYAQMEDEFMQAIKGQK